MMRSKKIINIMVIVMAFIFHLSPFTLKAQQPWNYASLQDIHLDDAYFIEPPASLKAQIQKTLSAQSLRHSDTQTFFNRLYRLSVFFRSNGKHQLQFQSDSLAFSIPEPLASDLLPYLVSDRYWNERYRRLQDWAFVNMDNNYLIDLDTADRRYGIYSPVTWLGYRYQPSEEWPVVFIIRTNTHRRQNLTLPALQRLAEWGAFTTDEGLQAYERNIQQQRQKELERQLALQQHLDSLDSVSRLMARQADSIKTALLRDSLNQAEQHLQAQVQATKDRMNRQQIFLMSVNSARSDYMFGLEFNFYNCFSKVISKIEISVTPVNAKGQIQKDQFNRDIRTIRCMGPIHPGSPAQYTFDELFWDDKGRIKFMRVSSVTFHFPDGSRKSFYGYEKILKHTLNP